MQLIFHHPQTSWSFSQAVSNTSSQWPEIRKPNRSKESSPAVKTEQKQRAHRRWWTKQKQRAQSLPRLVPRFQNELHASIAGELEPERRGKRVGRWLVVFSRQSSSWSVVEDSSPNRTIRSKLRRKEKREERKNEAVVDGALFICFYKLIDLGENGLSGGHRKREKYPKKLK